MGWIYISSGVGASIEHSRSNLVRHRKCAYIFFLKSCFQLLGKMRENSNL